MEHPLSCGIIAGEIVRRSPGIALGFFVPGIVEAFGG